MRCDNKCLTNLCLLTSSPLMNDEIVFAPLSAEMVEETASMHIRLMPNDLASRMGLSAVRDIFHLGTIEYSGGVGFVALSGRDIVGYCLAHVDFSEFSKFQNQKIFHNYRELLIKIFRHPSIIASLFGASRYLRAYPFFVNLGPLLVRPDFRKFNGLGDGRLSIAAELARITFERIHELAPDWPVLTMIRPDNMPSISAVAQGARRAKYILDKKSSITFGRDLRIIYEFRAQPAVDSPSASRK